GGKMHTKVTQSTDSKHSNKITPARAAVAERVKRCNTGAHERSAIDRRQILRHCRQRFGRSDHVVRITAIERNPGCQQRYLAREEIAPSAIIAISAVPTMPSNANSLTGCPAGNA